MVKYSFSADASSIESAFTSVTPEASAIGAQSQLITAFDDLLDRIAAMRHLSGFCSRYRDALPYSLILLTLLNVYSNEIGVRPVV